MDEAGKKFFEEIQAKKEEDRLLWNAAQESEKGMVYLSPEQEDAIMERMFLVNTILQQEKKIEELETEVERLRFHLNWPPRRKSYSDGTDYKR